MKPTFFSPLLVSVVVAGFAPATPATAQGAMYSSPNAQLAASIGLTPEEANGLTLTELNALKYAKGGDEHDTGPQPQGTTAGGPAPYTAQLAAGVGLTPEEASGLTLSDLNALKYARDGNDQEASARIYRARY